MASPRLPDRLARARPRRAREAHTEASTRAGSSYAVPSQLSDSHLSDRQQKACREKILYNYRWLFSADIPEFHRCKIFRHVGRDALPSGMPKIVGRGGDRPIIYQTREIFKFQVFPETRLASGARLNCLRRAES